MSITPVTPSTGSLPPSGASTGSSSSVRSTDNQSTYSSDLADGNALTISQFSSIVLSATNDADQAAWSTQQFNANSRNDFYNRLQILHWDYLQLL